MSAPPNKALQRTGVGRQAPAYACKQLVHLAQDLLDVQVRVFVLTDADGRLEQRKLLVALHQGGKVFQRGGHF